MGKALRRRSRAGLHTGYKVFGEKKTPRIDAESGQRQSIFLNRVALVLEQHHHHGDAEKHLRHRAKHAGWRCRDNSSQGICELSKAHQHGPERKRDGEHLERERIALVTRSRRRRHEA